MEREREREVLWRARKNGNHKEEKLGRGRATKMPLKESENSALKIAEINRTSKERKA